MLFLLHLIRLVIFFKNFENIRISTIKFNRSKLFNCILLILIFIFTVSLINILNNYFLRMFFFSICWFFVFYWLISTFTFLYKKSQYTIYTRIIQRFWKRSLYLFWLLELFLFSIYLFLTLISPQEVIYMMDNSYLYFSYTNNLLNFFKNLFNVIIIILISNLIILLFKYNTFNNFLFFILFILLFNVLFDDFSQFYYINQFYNNLVWKWEDETNTWDLEFEVLKLRTYMHYLYLLIFLKLWHTVFIVSFYLFFENITLHTKQISYNILSSNLQNFYFLLFFGFILKIIFLKFYMNYLYEYIYYWFYVNYHFYDFNHIYVIFNTKYLLFLVYDIINQNVF